MQRIGEIGMRGLAFFAIFVGALFQYWDLNSDIWFILNSGRFVVNHGIPHVEPLAMHEGLHYVMEQWLAAIWFWEIYDNWGASGLIAFTFVFGCIILYAYYRLCSLIGNNIIATVMAMTFGAIACRLFITTRPQIFSILIFIAEIYFFEKYARHNNWKWLVPVPVFSVLLVNLHAALWPMLFVLMLPYVATCFFEDVVPKDYVVNKFSVKPIILIGIISVLVGFLNPYGIEAMTFIFNSYDPEIHGQIDEVRPPSILTFSGGTFFFVLFLVFLFCARNPMPLQYLFLSAGTGFMGLLAARNELFFLLLGTIPVAFCCRNVKLQAKGASPSFLLLFAILGGILLWLPARDKTMSEIPDVVLLLFFFSLLCYLCFLFFYKEDGKLFDKNIPRLRIKYTAGILFFLISFAFIPFYTLNHSENFGEEQKPVIDYLLSKEDRKKIRLWTGFDTGAYAGFRGIKYYVDARPEVFLPANTHADENIMGDYFKLASGDLDYKNFFAKHNFTHILTCDGDGYLHIALRHDSDYKLMYEYESDLRTYRLYKIQNVTSTRKRS